MKIDLFLTLIVLVVSTLVKSNNPIIKTRFGRIEGILKKSGTGRSYQAYLEIPYALPPIGELRFEPPQPVVNAWEGVFQAQYPPALCLQHRPDEKLAPNQVTGTEDCLYLNVFVPVREVRNHTGLLPVIVFIYGGGFREGEGYYWKPNHIMDEDLIYVSFNHRLGPFGFLSTEDSVVPGNMGLKDQSLVLKWVSENIASFDGDPGKVTLAGGSSGSASVHLQYLSPMSRGLFQRIIMISGTALNCWAQTEGSLEKAKKLGMLVGCPTSDNQQMIKCLKSRPGKNIVDRVPDFMYWGYSPLVSFGPVVDKYSMNPFIDKSPIEIIESGEEIDMPWLLSTVTEEGIIPTSTFITNETETKDLDENWENIAPHLLDYNNTIPISEHANVAKKIRNFYMGDRRIELSNAADIIRATGDRLFGTPIAKFTKMLAKMNKNSTWLYYFSYRGEYSLSQEITDTNLNFGVSHGDEVYYIFSFTNKTLHTETDKQMRRDFLKLWASFARTGIPDMGGADWLPVERTSDHLNYLRISGPGLLRMESDDNFAEQEFWSTIDFNENKMPSN